MIVLLLVFVFVTLLSSAAFLKISSKAALSDFVNTNDASMKMINLVNAIYKLISVFRVERNKCFIESLIVYPIKSVGKGLKVQEWKVGEIGLMYDRQYVFVTYNQKIKEWTPITLKDCTEFINIEYEVEEGSFIIKYAKGRSFKLPMEVTKAYLDSISAVEEITVKLWLQHILSYDISRVLPAGFIELFDLPLDTKLLYTVQGHQVKQGSPENLSNTINGSKYRISAFQDYYPFLILSKNSLRYLNEQLSKTKFDYFKTNEHTFRPNIVVEGDTLPHDEDTWYRFRINTQEDGQAHYFRTCIKCARCTIPNIDVEGDRKMHKKGPVTKVLSKYRRVDIGNRYMTYFGIYAIQHETGYTLRSGDTVDILQRKVNFFDNPFGSLSGLVP